MLCCALAVLSKPFHCLTIHFLCGSLSGSASRLRRGVFQRSADHIRGRLCFSWAVRCFALLFHDGACRCLCRANSCCAQQSLCFAIIAINASPSLRGEMPYLCVANPATLSLCLQCFSLTARYIAILSLLHVLLYLTHSKSIATHFRAMPSPRLSKLSPCAAAHIPLHALPRTALLIRRLSARVIACAGQSLVKNWPTQPSALRGRPMAQGAG